MAQSVLVMRVSSKVTRSASVQLSAWTTPPSSWFSRPVGSITWPACVPVDPHVSRPLHINYGHSTPWHEDDKVALAIANHPAVIGQCPSHIANDYPVRRELLCQLLAHFAFPSVNRDRSYDSWHVIQPARPNDAQSKEVSDSLAGPGRVACSRELELGSPPPDDWSQ